MFYINALLNATQDVFGFTAELNPACEVSQKHGGVPDCEDFTTTEFFQPTVLPTTQAATTLENPREILCRQDPMDIVFVVDGSTSMQLNNFNKQIQFMKNLVDVMTVGASDTRVAMVQFSDGPATLEFRWIDDGANLESAFDGVTYRANFQFKKLKIAQIMSKNKNIVTQISIFCESTALCTRVLHCTAQLQYRDSRCTVTVTVNPNF